MTFVHKRRARTTRETAQGDDLYAQVTRKIIGDLEAGRLPWVQPWGRAGGPSPALPRNALSGRCYSGINILMLWGAVIEGGWPSQSWITFKQAIAAGGCVRKGEHGTMVVYADKFVPAEAGGQGSGGQGSDAQVSAGAGETGPKERDGAPRAIPFLKRFTLFNVAQCEGLPPDIAIDPAPLPERQIIPEGEALIAASGVPFVMGGDRAFYAPALDRVQVPPQPAFFDQINFYRTCFHELCHATGHPARLARDLAHPFGSKGYAREELIAEMGAAFLCASLGICPTIRHADYIGGWLELLHDDLSDDPHVRGSGSPRGRAIFRAASAAGKAADWLLARYHDARTGQAA